MLRREWATLAMAFVSALGSIALSLNMAHSPYPDVRKDATLAIAVSAVLIVGLLAILIHASFKRRRGPAA